MVRSLRRSPRGLLAAGMAAVLLSVGLAIPASPAAAHTKLSPYPTCSGVELSHKYHFSFQQGTVSLFLFYSSANGGTNCAWAQKQFARGTPTSMELQLARCASNSGPCNPSGTDIKRDSGNFSYYAGPVSVEQAAGRCIQARVRIGANWSPWTYPPHNCG